jgi:hypothetical protein
LHGLSFTERQLQHEFVHAADFGVAGSSTAATRADFLSALVDHIDDPTTQRTVGWFGRSQQPAVHYFNPNTGLNVFTDVSGGFWGAWRLGPGQIRSLQETGGFW